MHIQVVLAREPILPTLQQHGVHLLTWLSTWLLSLSRTPEPSRVPQPVRPDAPDIRGSLSRPHDPAMAILPATRSEEYAAPPSPAATSAARPRFSALPAKFLSAALNLFHSAPTKLLPGTLHHSGNRPAPPSDDTPLARRSAVETRPSGNLAARVGLKTCSERNPGVPVCAPKTFVRS